MSSIKDIMDVDVEPLESQAYRRFKGAARRPPQPSQTYTSPFPSPLIQDDYTDNGRRSKTAGRWRRINRAFMELASSSALHPDNTNRQTSAGGEGYVMGYNTPFGTGVSNQANAPESPQSPVHSRSESAPAIPIKYTPVTGRISRAKKGVPIHTCEICRPVKHRRHQLSHQKPAYPCTVQDCDRAFHRWDLLQRHRSRHEPQGEKLRRASDPPRPSSPVMSESPSPLRKTGSPNIDHASGSSPAGSMTTRTMGSSEGSTTMTMYRTAVGTQPILYGATASPETSRKRTASQAQLAHGNSYSHGSKGPALAQDVQDFSQASSTYTLQSNTDLNGRSNFIRSAQHTDQIYSEEGSSQFSSFSPASQPLPNLRIPEVPYIPSLVYTQTKHSWYSSGSESTYSNSEGSRGDHHHGLRGRSTSIATVADWSAPSSAAQWSPAVGTTTTQDSRASFDPVIDQYGTRYASPHEVSTSSQHLVMPATAFGNYYIESVDTGPPTYKPISQHSSTTARLGLAVNMTKSPKELMGHQPVGSLVSPPAPGTRALSRYANYIASFWRFFDPLYPVIHRGTKFEENNLLKFAIAALGTQYHDDSEAREIGAELNDYCRINIDLVSAWNLQTMQAILLTEMFTRFRGRKTNIRFSHQFEGLYTKLLNKAAETVHVSQNTKHTRNLDAHVQWTNWVETESRHRLLNLCFIFDVHHALFLEQERAAVNLEATDALFLLPCPEGLWNASNVSDWQSQRSSYVIQPLRFVEQHILSTSYTYPGSAFAIARLISSFAARLPNRHDLSVNPECQFNAIHPAVKDLARVFPTSPLAHTYLALHYTPLRDLLAVAGDTWVFAKKVTPASAFHFAQQRLRSWSVSLAAATATQHACRVLKLKLAQIYPPGRVEQAPQILCISDYWGLYTAALTCWAFGQRYHPAGTNGTQALNDEGATPEDQARQKTLCYINAMLNLNTMDLLSNKAVMRGDTAGVIDAVCKRLETVGVGNKCMMLVDAICVLRRLTEGGKAKWF